MRPCPWQDNLKRETLVLALHFLRSYKTMMDGASLVLQKITEIVERMPNQRILLSTLGLLLQQQVPGFAPAEYGHRTFKDFLRAVPDFAVLSRGEHPGQWWMTLRKGGSEEEEAHNPPEKLLPQVWERVIDFDPANQAWFDLETGQVSRDDAAVQCEPDRYLALPRFPLARQMEMARAWCATQDASQRTYLLASLDEEGSFDKFLAETTRLKLRVGWNQHRRRVIADAVRAWMQQHGITQSLLFGSERSHPSRAVRPMAPPAVTAMAGMTLDEYRRLLHRMIDAMTEDELLHISVPGRFLVRGT